MSRHITYRMQSFYSIYILSNLNSVFLCGYHHPSIHSFTQMIHGMCGLHAQMMDGISLAHNSAPKTDVRTNTWSLTGSSIYFENGKQQQQPHINRNSSCTHDK